jgi:putative protein-disulfide isomerase
MRQQVMDADSVAVTAPSLLYVADAMCSWCWGFAPSLDALLTREPALQVKILCGGLRPGPAAQRMGGGLANYLASAWQQVQRRSGQPFDWGLLARPDFLYDTDPPARAQIAYSNLGLAQPYGFFRSLQEAFYAQGRDITDSQVLVELAVRQGAERNRYALELAAETTVRQAAAGYVEARELGVRGFPALFLESDQRSLLPLTHGWVGPETLLASYDRVQG